MPVFTGALDADIELDISFRVGPTGDKHRFEIRLSGAVVEAVVSSVPVASDFKAAVLAITGQNPLKPERDAVHKFLRDRFFADVLDEMASTAADLLVYGKPCR